MTQRTSERGTTYTVGSSSGWADWEKEAAKACCLCGRRVTLKDSSRSAWPDRVWHVGCELARVEVSVR